MLKVSTEDRDATNVTMSLVLGEEKQAWVDEYLYQIVATSGLDVLFK